MSCRFIYAFLGLGAILCVVTCAGHIAAETVNGCCLYVVNFFCPIKAFLTTLLMNCSIYGLTCLPLVVSSFLTESILVFLFM